jgi:hypothetical protein
MKHRIKRGTPTNVTVIKIGRAEIVVWTHPGQFNNPTIVVRVKGMKFEKLEFEQKEKDNV